MIYLELFWGFLKVGMFSFGGAYSAIPLIRDAVLSNGWMSEGMLTDMIAVSESTPGPIMVNLATYVGSRQGGVLGAAIATVAVALPAFFIILLIMAVLKNVLNNRYAIAVMDGLKSCVVGVILATGAEMLYSNLIPGGDISGVDYRGMIIGGILAILYFGSRKVLKKGISPILLIVISAVAGIAAYGI